MQDALLEEYKTLREEILLHVLLEKQIFALSGTLYFLALTFMTGLKMDTNFDLLGIILLLLLIPLFIIYRNEVFTIGKIASYIEKCIEPNVKYLDWTRLHIRSTPKYESKFLKWTVWPSYIGVSIYFIILFLLSWLIPIYLKGSFYSLRSLAIMGVLSLVYMHNFIILINYKKYRTAWEKVWEESLRQHR